MADRGRNCVVFIVEGDSDRIALEQPMTALFDMIDETIKVVFCKPGILRPLQRTATEACLTMQEGVWKRLLK